MPPKGSKKQPKKGTVVKEVSDKLEFMIKRKSMEEQKGVAAASPIKLNCQIQTREPIVPSNRLHINTSSNAPVPVPLTMPYPLPESKLITASPAFEIAKKVTGKRKSRSKPSTNKKSHTNRDHMMDENETMEEEKQESKSEAATSHDDMQLPGTPTKRPKTTNSNPTATTVPPILPELRDPLQAIKKLPDIPISPSTAAGFVRRSERERKPSTTVLTERILTHPTASPTKNQPKGWASYGKDERGKPCPKFMRALKTSYPAVGTARLQLNQDQDKGLCVTTKSFIEEGAFVIEYAGDLLTAEESEQLEDEYSNLQPEVGCYMFYFKFHRKAMCIDATRPGPGEAPGAQLKQHVRPDTPIAPLPISPSKQRSASSTSGGTPPKSASITVASSSDVTVAAGSSSSSSTTPPPVLATLASHMPPLPPPSSLSSLPFADAVRPPETLGYGFARYINHKRDANLTVKLFDQPSTCIKTDRFNGAETKEQMREESEFKRSQSDSSTGSTTSSQRPLNLHRTYPRLCFFANRPIYGDEELTIDYGDRENTEDFPWLLS